MRRQRTRNLLLTFASDSREPITPRPAVEAQDLTTRPHRSDLALARNV